MVIITVLTLLLAFLLNFLLINYHRSTGQFPYVYFSGLIAAVLAYGFLIRKNFHDDELPNRFPANINLKLKPKSLVLLFASLIAACYLLLVYFIFGYSPYLLPVWLASIFLAAAAFWPIRAKSRFLTINKQDIIAISLLLLIFIPLYLFKLYEIPWQVNTDEITISSFAKSLFQIQNVDIFGLSSYFGFPTMIFVLWGNLAQILGGVDLVNIRTIHAVNGLLIILSSYFLFRSFYAPKIAVLASILMGSNHALLAISRMAMRDNTSLLLEILAFIFLFVGLVAKCPLRIFLGGLIAGLTFYTYFASRATPIIWFLFLGLIYIKLIHKVKLATIAKIILISSFGILISASPILIATVKDQNQGISYSKEALLIFAQGRELAKTWVYAPSVEVGVKENIYRGLLTFNSKASDSGWIYPNLGHGFVDPLTGLLIWLGLGTLIFKRRKNLEDVLFIGSFLFLYLIFAVFVNKAPSYTRLLVILPLTAVLTIEGAASITIFKFLPKYLTLITAVLIIFVINLNYFGGFAADGFKNGDAVGAIGRWTQSQAEINPNRQFVLISDASYPVYRWGIPAYWKTWIGFFAKGDQKVEILASGETGSLISKTRPYTVFVLEKLYKQNPALYNLTGNNKNVVPLTPDGRILAIDVLN